jgi:hypothetical protein
VITINASTNLLESVWTPAAGTLLYREPLPDQREELSYRIPLQTPSGFYMLKLRCRDNTVTPGRTSRLKLRCRELRDSPRESRTRFNRIEISFDRKNRRMNNRQTFINLMAEHAYTTVASAQTYVWTGAFDSWELSQNWQPQCVPNASTLSRANDAEPGKDVPVEPFPTARLRNTLGD